MKKGIWLGFVFVVDHCVELELCGSPYHDGEIGDASVEEAGISWRRRSDDDGDIGDASVEEAGVGWRRRSDERHAAR